MDPITSLLLLFLAKNSTAAKGGAPPAKVKKARAPRWPTPTSPPPMPAFQPKATPTPAQTADTATPLAELHAKPPVPPPAATDAVPKAAARKPARRTVRVPKIVPGVMRSTLPVLKLQNALNARGAKLKPDGLFGPKTATAWMKYASAKSLPPGITRVAPKLAQVVTHTYDALSLPPIP
jgi:hypothetical protein